MILMYHNVVPDNAPLGTKSSGLTLTLGSFKRQMEWLNRRFCILPMNKYLEKLRKGEKSEKKAIAITFDDGTAITFQCVFPVLKEQNIPATFFVTTCHLDGELMWGSYLNALCLEGIYETINVDHSVFPLKTLSQRRQAQMGLYAMARESSDPVNFSNNLGKSYPLPEKVSIYYKGMSYEQLRIAGESNVIEIGSHCLTHSDLNRQPKEIQEHEISESKRILEEHTGRTVRYLAYPSGNYNRDTLELVKVAGYEAAFATIPRKLGTDMRLEMERTGIYSSSMLKLIAKMSGAVKFARWFGLSVG